MHAITLDNENILSKMFPRAGEFFVGGVCTLAFTYLTTKLYLVDLNNKFDDFRFISFYVLSDYEELYDVFYGSILLQQRSDLISAILDFEAFQDFINMFDLVNKFRKVHSSELIQIGIARYNAGMVGQI